MITRRQFTVALGTLAAAGMSGGLFRQPMAATNITMKTSAGYGPLIEDPNGILALPEGFSYQVLSSFGDKMDDGLQVPDRADGMGCLPLDENRVALIRNHELQPKHLAEFGPGQPAPFKSALAYDNNEQNEALPGGTTTLVYNTKTGIKEQEYLSLIGTVRNCSGGVTPWGSWLTCEESVDTPSDDGNKYHGYVFEVPATANELVEAKPLKALGRFNHEAACVDPETGIVYLTEDRDDSVLYRFLPDTPGRLADGGRLQAMMIDGLADTRNWTGPDMATGTSHTVRWIDCTGVEAPQDDLRLRAAADGAALIARGEGIHTGTDEVFICSTSGGQRKLGQIFRLVPGRGARADTIELFFESESEDQFNYGDNLTVGPNGHLIVCEDQYTDVVDNHLRGITPDGRAYAFGRLRLQTELAGGCFSPDGKWFFVNAYSPTHTLAITGPWAA